MFQVIFIILIKQILVSSPPPLSPFCWWGKQNFKKTLAGGMSNVPLPGGGDDKNLWENFTWDMRKNV